MTAPRWAILICAIFILLALFVRLAEPDRTRKAGLHLDPYNPAYYVWKYVPKR